MRIPKYFWSTAIIFLWFQGCATDSRLQITQMSFDHECAVAGEIRVDKDPMWYIFNVQLKNRKTGETFKAWGGEGGFFVRVSPGRYTLDAEKMWQNNGQSVRTIELNATSSEVEVNPGEVVYIGSTSIILGNQEGPSLRDPGTWLGMVLGRTESQIQIGYNTYDKSEQEINHLKTLRSQKDFKFVTRLIYFSSSGVVKESPKTSVPGFIDSGFATDVKISKFRYDVEGKSEKFSRQLPKVIWFGMPDKNFQPKIKEKKVKLEIQSPRHQIVMVKNLETANDLGLVIFEIPIEILVSDAEKPGVWTLELKTPDAIESVAHMTFEIT